MADEYLYRGNAPVRLNKWMAELGLCSRREAEALIEAGGVFVDEEKVERPGHKIEPGQTLKLAERAQRAIASKFTAVLNKPVDYVSAQPEEARFPQCACSRRPAPPMAHEVLLSMRVLRRLAGSIKTPMVCFCSPMMVCSPRR